MAITDIRCRVTIPFKSGLATDVSVNTLHFVGDPAVDDLQDLADAIVAFYNTENTGATAQRPVSGYFSETMDRQADGCRIDFFEVGVPGPPFSGGTWTLGPRPDGTGLLPSEVAACLSFHADYAGLNSAERARRRGRIFLGALDRIAGEADAAFNFRPSAQFRYDVLHAAVEFLSIQAEVGNFVWQIHSPTGNLQHAVAVTSMDNAFDTLRSRGPDPTVTDTLNV